MFGLIIIALIIFAVYKAKEAQRERARLKAMMKADWRDKVREHTEKAARYAAQFQRDLANKIERETTRHKWSFEQRMADKFERKAAHIERRMRRKFNRETHRYGGDPVSKFEESVPTPQFKTDAERQAFERARKRAAAEAGFYIHLMWYGLIIGGLFIINLMTTTYPWFVWPAIGWGFGLASHYVAVFGWRWVHERVFEPAIQREVQREVMQEKEALATEKQASLDELTATFAHEIRNPIAAAKSLVQQMGEDPKANENVEYAKVALDELARVERSVSHLLKYAKEEDYHFESANLATVLDSALTQMRAKLESHTVAVSRNYLGGPMVRTDADKLRQVFSNIIDNAIDAMDKTQGERRLEVAIQRGRNAMATVRIRDNGCGIPEDKLGKIFNPFYTSKTNGTGLGLGVAKKVIDAHRGTIEVNSRVGVGTEFIMAIPLADAPSEMFEQEPVLDDGSVASSQPAMAANPTPAPAGTGPIATSPATTGIATPYANGTSPSPTDKPEATARGRQ